MTLPQHEFLDERTEADPVGGMTVESEMERMLAGQLPPIVGDHIGHVLEHLQLAGSTLWSGAGDRENFLLFQHMTGHLNEWLIKGKRFTEGPRSIEESFDRALNKITHVRPMV